MKKTNLFRRRLVIIITVVISTTAINAQIPVGSYKIVSRVINNKPVSPLIYGNFIELGFGRQIEGMWSEKLFNASFEEITPYKSAMWSYLRRTPDEDLTLRPWWHSGYEENPWCSVLSDGKDVTITYWKYGGFYHGY